ncbi:hypothetical protein M8J77_013209 [Diaphorina citri]|nr:hypothetical protein M8J77_013209 [Diaphorina citri]
MVVPQASINNIMGGIESTGGVRLHNHRRKLKQRFDIVRKLGQGNYGKVQLGINKETGQEVAIKTIKKCKIETEADLIRIRREIQIMSSVRHPNIIHIYEVFENREKMVLVMEYAAGGELYDFLDQKKVLTEEEARRIFRQIATAVYYCHKHKICHRDLKLENILLDENGNAKIADFGLSNVFTESRFLSTFCGSPLYASPEIVKGIPYHGPEVDCWSLGVLLYTLVYGAMPFDGSNFKRLVKQISNGDYFEPKNQSTASPLIAEMLNINPSSRADISVICSHWWIDKDHSVACLEEAEELANQTPVRLDLLLSLAPSPSTDKILVGADAVIPTGESNRPLRSQSLGNIPPIMEMPTEHLQAAVAPPEEPAQPDSPTPSSGPATGVKRKENSSTTTNKPKRDRSRSRSGVKKQGANEETTPAPTPAPKTGNTLEEPQAVVQEPITPVAEIPQPGMDSGPEEIYPDEQALETLTPNTPDPLVSEPITPLPAVPTPDVNLVDTKPTANNTPAEETVEKAAEKTATVEEKAAEKTTAKPYTERRRSSVLETVEKFNKQPATPPKKVIIPGTKVTGGAPAKKVYERKPSTGTTIPLVNSTSRQSLSEISPNVPANTAMPRKTDSPPIKKVEPSPSAAKFCLASTVNVNLLAEQALSSPEVDTEVVQPPPYPNNTGEEHEKTKMVKNAVKVIGNALGGSSDSLDKKSSTLPRRKSKADFVQPTPFVVPITTKPSGEFRSEIRHMVNSPPTVTQRTEVTFPVSAAPTPTAAKSVTRQGNQSREHIIPIMFEQDVVPQTPPPSQGVPLRKSSSQQSQHNISRTSSRSLSRQSTCDSDSSVCSSGDPIRKSAREVIIPIAVEGGGYITPSSTALNRINSITESEDDASANASGSNAPRCFTLRSTRRRLPSQTSSGGLTNNKSVLETADSVSSDEDDDNFEILTAENLFSTLLSRVRSLTQRLNTDEHRSAFPRSIFHHGSLFDNPATRLSETRSFSRADGIHPWRRSLSREPLSGGSSSTLPRANVTVHVPKRVD